MMVGRRPLRCQWTARQLATVLLPLPPFMVATVMIELVTYSVSPLSAKATNPGESMLSLSGWTAYLPE